MHNGSSAALSCATLNVMKTEREALPEVSLLPIVALANELKAPLAYISGASSILLEEAAALAPEQQLLVRQIMQSSDRMIRIVQGLANVRQIGQTELSLEPVNIRQAIEEAAHDLAPLSRSLGCPIEVKVARSAGLVVAHREFLEHALFALIDEALRQKARNKEALVVTGRVQHQQTRVNVAQGTDISRADFARLERTIGRELQPIRANAPSTGIGLYVARHLTEAMRGTFGLERTQRTGASVFIDLHSSSQLSLVQ